MGMTQQQVEEQGFEALQRLYLLATDFNHDHGIVAARFLLGLYNGYRFPFDLTDLRLLEPTTFQDAMAVLVMDARLTRKEVHNYFSEGGKKFERLVQDWNITDVQRLKKTGDGSPTPRAQRGMIRHEEDLSAKLVTIGNAPGYRDVRLTFDCEVIGSDRRDVGQVRVCMSVNAEDGVTVMNHIKETHQSAWSRGRPIDARPDESAPCWALFSAIS
ncbi:MAG: hypothetical protein ACK4F8_11575 [Aquabacterium sp.]